jgi:hypothetical protein
MRKILLVLLTLATLGFAAAPAAADPPTTEQFSFTFEDVNPCTGLIHTVTIAGTAFFHDHDGRTVGRAERTITTTPTGFVGRGTESFVDNGHVFMDRLTDILTNPAGDRIRAQFVIVVDLSTDPVTVRVEKGAVTCLGPA